MEKRLFKEFYRIKSIHLGCGSNFLNGEDWIKQVVAKILHITYSQWVVHNVLLHDKQRGHPQRKDLKTIMVKIETLLDTRLHDMKYQRTENSC